jgi:HAD superfamily hydrolase (TIGR01549 family)
MRDTIKYISFDIFDTLLFRTVRRPDEVFEKAFERIREMLPDYMDARDWREMRYEVERRVRKKKYEKFGNYEVTLSEIYGELPKWIEERDQMLKIELDIEKEYCYLNTEVYEKMKWINSNTDKKMVLISDMYLNRSQLEEILAYNEFDLDLVEGIYVSCEHYASKRSGSLYEVVLKDLMIKPNELLHVGDNEISDISSAKKLGIYTEFYDTISLSDENNQFLQLEELRYRNNASEIYALRNYVGSLYRDENPNDQYWYKLGSMILGPLFTFGMEWILDIAEENRINKIYPLMREGKLLGKLLRNAAQERGAEVDVTELYISRNAVYLPSLEEISPGQIDYIITTTGLKVRDVFRILDIPEYGQKFKAYYDYEISKSRDVLYEETNLYDYIRNELQTEEIKSIIYDKAALAKETVLKYFDQLGMNESYITVDVGWRGTIQGGINRIQKKPNNIHLLLIGVTNSIDNVFNNCDVRGYAGSFGRNKDDINDIFPRIFEMFSTCDEGTTIGYEDCGGVIKPITREIKYVNSDQMSNIGKCQEGILAFQKEYFKLRKKKPIIERLKERPEELVRIIGRLTSTPLHSEARILGDLYFDQNFGADQQWKVIDQEIVNKIKEQGLYNFHAQSNSRQIEWYAGLYALNDPFYYFNRYYTKKGWNEKVKRLAFAQHIRDISSGKLVIVGAGAAGRDIYNYLRMAGDNELVECFVDNDIAKQNTYLYGKKVCSIDDNFESDTYVVGSFAYISEITNRIRSAKGDKVRIISYRGEEST